MCRENIRRVALTWIHSPAVRLMTRGSLMATILPPQTMHLETSPSAVIAVPPADHGEGVSVHAGATVVRAMRVVTFTRPSEGAQRLAGGRVGGWATPGLRDV